MALSLDAGVAILRVWQGEADRSSGRAREACQTIADGVRRGDPLDQSVAAAAPFFPPLFVEMTRVGEQTGALPETLTRLGEHYRNRVQTARDFRAMIAWPMLQLAVALAVVALMILIGGVLRDGRGGSIDLLGFGLVGPWGLTIYLGGLAAIATAAALAWRSAHRRPALGARLVELATRVPVLGDCLKKIALARIAWALRLLLNVELDLRRVAPMAMRASGNGRYAQHGGAVAAAIEAGRPLSEALADTGEFPQDFLNEVIVAEESGRLVEAMNRLSGHYQQQAETATRRLAGVLAGAVWLAVAATVIALIFRLFGFYTGALNDALEGL